MPNIMTLDDWEKDIRQRTNKIPRSQRPRRPIRAVNSRSPEESDALAYAVMIAWDNALESGVLREENGGYTICIPKKKS